jgi:hypothetical protein
MVGADDVSTEKMVGKIDTLRVNEYPEYQNESEYKKRMDSWPPGCMVNITGIDCVAKYGEHTEYMFAEQDPVIDVKIYEPTHADVEEPTNSLELYKKQIGSMEYLTKFWNYPDSVPTESDLNRWRWELKFMRVPWYLDRTKGELQEWEIYKNEEISSPR